MRHPIGTILRDESEPPADGSGLARLVASSQLRTPWATFALHGFEEIRSGREHVALTLGHVGGGHSVLVRMHSECLTGDVLFSRRCDCGSQLKLALRTIASEKRGALIYLRQEGRGIGLLNKIRAYRLQDAGADTVEANNLLGFAADLREYAIGASILGELGIRRVRLMTNNPDKIKALESFGIHVTERLPLLAGHNKHNARYLQTKASQLGHFLCGD